MPATFPFGRDFPASLNSIVKESARFPFEQVRGCYLRFRGWLSEERAASVNDHVDNSKGAGTLRGPGLRSNVALYLGARAFGQVGHNLFIASLFIIAGTGDHAAVGLGSLMAASTVSAMAFGIPGGALADRIGAARGFAFGGALRAAIIAVALLGIVPIAAVAIVALAYAAVSQLHNPSEMALVKVLCDRSAGRLHSLLVALQYAGQGIGMLVLAPALYFLGGVELAMLGALVLVAGQVAVSALLAVRLHGTDQATVRENGRPFAGLRATAAVFAHSEPAKDALAVHAIRSLVTQVILVAFPLYVRHDLSLGTEGAAYLLAPGIAGVTAGLAWAAAGLSLHGTARAMRLSTLGMAVAVCALAALDYGVTAAFTYSQVPPLVRFEAALNMTAIVAMPVAFLVGASISVSMVSARAALTAAAPLALQSRVFAVQSTVADALTVLPLLFAGVAAELLGARTTLAALGLLCAVTWLLMWHPRFQLSFLARRAPASA